MSRLVVELGRYGRLVFGRVLEQDESLRNETGELLLWAMDGRFAIKSARKPALGKSALFVRGHAASEDDTTLQCLFDTEEEAIQYVEYIHEGVRAINTETKGKADATVIQLEVIGK